MVNNRRILSDAQLEEMVRLRERNLSYAAIARHFTERGTPVSAGSIAWQCLRLGADVPAQFRRSATPRSAPVMRNGRQVRPFTPEEDAKLLRLEAAGTTIFRIAREMKRGDNSIRGRLYSLARQEARSEGKWA